ncbi:carboxymuconolactone decarboxylase family protein [Emticicia sp. 21SJ11W-3]|uniref:carboxymuconolactone decarboxylase family protein n=1 Tax=Emticicia sp. 21SJ11W-3 TaxID=2916755 RepID=UPI00209DC9F2|nr:carboxymuconolactone decarboxylase family protein [Emticicia sp. 21SJ11W-3]UTA69361.1 carboxymuconolactone decarboxylase family protein [Emticicia sp. 21SJ11W-3]
MSNRINILQIEPTAYKAMMGLEAYLQSTQVSKSLKHLIKIKASIINGCAYCVNMHTREARKDGETEQRIYLLSAWRETTLYTEEERTALALTEEVTMIQNQASNETYLKAERLFGPTLLAQIIMVIVTINAWNRIAITTELPLD